MFYFVLQCVYLMLPGIVGNSIPVMMKSRLIFLAKPIDGGRTWKGKPIFGANKTWRGFIFGTVSAIIVVFIQSYLYDTQDFFYQMSLLPYSEHNSLLLGFLMGFGVLAGDAVESFVKRRLDIAPGQSFFPWDQLDSLIGGLVLLALIYIPPFSVILTILGLSIAIHVATRHVAYWLGINKTKW